MTVEELLQKILDELRRLNSATEKSPAGFDWMVLLALPDHLRKTALILAKQGYVTAQDVSDITHRARAVESAYLNQLVNFGLAKKERKGRKVFFHPNIEEVIR